MFCPANCVPIQNDNEYLTRYPESQYRRCPTQSVIRGRARGRFENEAAAAGTIEGIGKNRVYIIQIEYKPDNLFCSFPLQKSNVTSLHLLDRRMRNVDLDLKVIKISRRTWLI